jgi:TonB family protein
MFRSLILALLFSTASWAQNQPTDPPAVVKTNYESSISPNLKVLTEVPAQYPLEALKKGIHGQVVLHVLVTEAGVPEKVSVVSGDEELRQAAVEAVQHWKFEAYFENGKPIAVGTTIPINFNLPETIQLPAGSMKDYIVHRVDPKFPRPAVTGRAQGMVVLHVIIGKDGKIKDLAIVSGQSTIAHAAFDAVRQWRFRPYELGKEPVQVDTTIEVQFSLSN